MIIGILINLQISLATAVAGGWGCDGLGLDQAYRSIVMHETSICFVYAKSSESEEGKFSVPPHGVYIYSVSRVGRSALVHELPYAGTKGKINDAFLHPVDGVEALFVIHSIEKPRSWDPISDVYDVSVFKYQNGTLSKDQKLSRFFGMGGDFVDSQGRPTFTYPYKDKASIEAAVRSPQLKAVTSTIPAKGVIKEKAFLYEGNSEPAMQSKMYLIDGDQVMVTDSMDGWCKVAYAGKARLITKWVQCKMIVFPEGDSRND